MKRDFFSEPRESLTTTCRELGVSEVHARDLFRLAYKGLSPFPWRDARFPRRLAEVFESGYEARGPVLGEALISGYDRSVKFRVDLGDGSQVEAVLMPEKKRLTLCLSSQVGCAQACVFCHTGRMGLKRNLTTGEIVGQVVAADRWIREHPEWLAETRLPSEQRVTNIVFMGMGEPLDNVDSVAAALNVLTDAYGLGLGPGRISVSTAGHLDGIEKLFAAMPRARLALSVHSTDEAKRSKIMPINRRWPLGTVLARLKELVGSDGPPVMLQYTLIKDVNDSVEEAARLATLASGLNAKVNLIPLNEVGPSRLTAPPPERIQAFRDVLHAAGLRVMVRYSKGQDIAAACGQLVVAPNVTGTAAVN